MVIRSWRSCVSWFVFGAAFVLGLIYCDKTNCEEFNLAPEMRLTLGLMALLGLQGFLAEALGLWADENGFSIPRRIFPHLGFPVLWRRKIPGRSLSRIDAIDSRMVRLYLTSTERVDFVFADNEKRRRFLRFVNQFYSQQAYVRRATGEN
ncbi:hypothetical protein [Methylocystis sp.]|uniref:hypothetical protein n=1 Tax=Methylocystis sp. TaxID=1911079 RepID=UPI0025FD980B|nr:hypothetical protein [Methylocystis sp.]